MSSFIRGRTAVSRIKFTLLLLGSFVGVTAANAADDVPSVVVKYTQESLADSGGVNDLYRRITRAATQVCPDASVRDLALMHLVAQCREQAVTRAIRQIDNPRLAALHAARSKNG